MTDQEFQHKISWLRRYQDALRREKILEEELEKQDARAKAVTPMLTGMPGSGSGDKFARAVESIISIKQELQAQVNQCGYARLQVVEVINQVTDPRDHDILRRRYILGQRFEEIAVEMCLDFRWVRRLHKRAIWRLKLPQQI